MLNCFWHLTTKFYLDIRLGTFCNCTAKTSALLISQCLGPDMKEPCSGRGDCLDCGTCACFNPEQFEGPYCEYDKTQCERYGGFLCNGTTAFSIGSFLFDVVTIIDFSYLQPVILFYSQILIFNMKLVWNWDILDIKFINSIHHCSYKTVQSHQFFFFCQTVALALWVNVYALRAGREMPVSVPRATRPVWTAKEWVDTNRIVHSATLHISWSLIVCLSVQGVCNGRSKCQCGRCECPNSGIELTSTCEPNFQVSGYMCFCVCEGGRGWQRSAKRSSSMFYNYSKCSMYAHRKNTGVTFN